MGCETGNPVRTPNKPLTEMNQTELCVLAWKLCEQIKKEAPDEYRGGVFPSNITVNGQGNITIGPGKPNGWDGEELRFIAPELYWNGRRSPASDIYSIGMLLWYGASGGHLPFDADGKTSEQKRMSGEPFDPPETSGENLGAIIAKATAFNISGRYQTMDEMAAALKAGFPDLFPEEESNEAPGPETTNEDQEKTEHAAEPLVPENSTAEKTAESLPETDTESAENSDKASAETEKEPESEAETEALDEEPDMDEPASSSKKADQTSTPSIDPVYFNGAGVNPVVRYTNDRERERKIRNEIKRRRRRPIIAIVILCLLVVAAAGMTDGITSGRIDLSNLSAGISFESVIQKIIGKAAQSVEPVETASAESTPEPTAEPTPEPTPEATPEPTAEPEMETVYTVYKENVSWTEAEQKCEELGGHLAVVHNADELNEIIRQAEDCGAEFVWLGCHRVNGELVWVNSDKVYYYKWGDGEPSAYDAGDKVSEDYLLLWKMNGKWFYNDSRNDPAADYPGMYNGKIAYACETTEAVEKTGE